MYFQYYILSALLLFVLPLKYKALWTFLAVALGAVVVAVEALEAFGICNSVIDTPSMDMVSALFSLLFSLVFLVVIAAMGGAVATSGHSPAAQSLHWASIVVLYYSLQGVLLAQAAFDFLFHWELMTISLVLLASFNSSNRKKMHTAVSLLVVMHAGFFVLLGAFSALPLSGTLFSPAANGGMSIGLWILFLVGFMVKSAVFPFHFWLPRSYGAAPAWVSALMGGAVTNIGIYGIIRIMSAVNDLQTASLVLMSAGAVSALYGALRLPTSHSLRVMLSNSSIDNIGLVVMALGLGFYGKASGNVDFAFLGFLGATLQLVFHALGKAMLFLAVGRIEDSVGDCQTSELGGLIHRMGWTTAMFAVGALSIMAIVPLGGFFGEFAIFAALFSAVSSGAEPVVGIVGILVVALVASITIFSFSKTFGVAFLGKARTAQASQAIEIKGRAAKISHAVLGVALIFGGGALMIFLCNTVCGLYGIARPADGESVTGALWGVWYVSIILVVCCAALFGLKKLLERKRVTSVQATWSCADGATEPSMQYNDESFAREAGSTFSLPESGRSKKTVFNLIPAHIMRRMTGRLALLQTGQTSHYIMHIIIFMTLVLILTLTGVL